jgi:hypothetical protein
MSKLDRLISEKLDRCESRSHDSFQRPEVPGAVQVKYCIDCLVIGHGGFAASSPVSIFR